MSKRKYSRGEALTAESVNAIFAELDELRALLMGRGGKSNEQGALALAFSAIDPDLFVPCRMTDVRLVGEGFAAPGGLAFWPSQVSYRIVGIRRGGIDLDNMVPVYGRPVRGDETRLYPASVGMVCVLVRSPAADDSGEIDSQLMLLPDSEIVARRLCTTSQPASRSLIERDMERLRIPRRLVAGSPSAVGALKATTPPAEFTPG